MRKNWQKHVGLLLTYGLVTLVMTYPLVFRLNQLPINVADPERHLNRDSFVFLWTFWWIKHSLFELHIQPLFSNYLFHPHGTSLVFLPFTAIYGLLSLPFQWILPKEMGVVTAYSTIVICSFILGAYVMYVLAHEVTADSAAAFVAGLVYSFCANRIWNLSALNLFCFEFVALFVFCLLRLFKAPSIWRGVWTGVSFALLFNSSLEYALYSSLFTILLLVAYIISRRSERDYLKSLVKNGLISLVGFAVLAAPLMVAICAFSSTSTLSAARMNFDVPVAFSNDFFSFVIPSFYQKFYNLLINFRFLYSKGIDWRVIGLKSFLGYTALGLAIVGVVKGVSRQKWFWLLSLCAFLLLSMGPYVHAGGRIFQNLPLPYILLYKWIPFFQVARAPERMIVLVTLSLAVLSAYGMKAIMDARPRWKWVTIALVSGFVLLENTGAPFSTGTLPVPNVYKQMATENADYAILDIPMNEDMRPISMYFQIFHEKPIVGGQVPRRSRGSMDFLNSDGLLKAVIDDKIADYYLELIADPEQQVKMTNTRQKLIGNHVRYIFLHTWHMTKRDEELARKLIQLLGPAGQVLSIPYMQGEIVVYRTY